MEAQAEVAHLRLQRSPNRGRVQGAGPRLGGCALATRQLLASGINGPHVLRGKPKREEPFGASFNMPSLHSCCSIYRFYFPFRPFLGVCGCAFACKEFLACGSVVLALFSDCIHAVFSTERIEPRRNPCTQQTSETRQGVLSQLKSVSALPSPRNQGQQRVASEQSMPICAAALALAATARQLWALAFSAGCLTESQRVLPQGCAGEAM